MQNNKKIHISCEQILFSIILVFKHTNFQNTLTANYTYVESFVFIMAISLKKGKKKDKTTFTIMPLLFPARTKSSTFSVLHIIKRTNKNTNLRKQMIKGFKFLDFDINNRQRNFYIRKKFIHSLSSFQTKAKMNLVPCS